ncbi:MAG: hypothetical protein WCQ99_05335 [Pseudomonadota bacterium]
MSGWIIEHQCPQCGGHVKLEESDHLLTCQYCRVRLYLVSPDYFRYCLIPQDIPEQEIIFAPYWRVKGMEFWCTQKGLQHRVVDTSFLSAGHSALPQSLGLRPQALKLHFAVPGSKARFLTSEMPFKAAFSRWTDQGKEAYSPLAKDRLFFREFIGETVSMIYAPLYLKDESVYDAILKRPEERQVKKNGADSFAFTVPDGKEITFIPTLCPLCGWQLEGVNESCVLLCVHCDSAWQASATGFNKTAHEVADAQEGDVLYVPFWKIKADVEGEKLRTYADLIRFANLPKAVQQEWEDRELYFWSPAFKIQPNLFLRIAKQITGFQPCLQTQDRLGNRTFYPVTLPASEAAESIKVTLAELVLDKKKGYPRVSNIKISVRESSLAFLPFVIRSNELVACHMGFSIDRNALKFGRNI